MVYEDVITAERVKEHSHGFRTQREFVLGREK
jgi:hypothetical protein